ncbi:uncharacterized protein si:dkey-27h10.2 [Antennarius striatus]|uniref:uncharacterized protein si:dkey-27h10.2 n=1 Tax=Antennarius striatus TaxID=241820 RepID=UPI0035B4BD8C
MSSIAWSFLILGLVVAFVAAQETSTVMDSNATLSTLDFSSTTNMSITSSAMNITNISTTPSLTTKEGNESLTSATPSTTTHSKTTTSKPRMKTTTTTAEPLLEANESTGIIILVVIILVALMFGVVCYVVRKRGRRYSVDFSSRPDEANIPLSVMDPELPREAMPQNGLKTFENPDPAAGTSKEPEVNVEVQDEQKVEPGDSSTEAAAAPPQDRAESELENGGDARSPASPVEEKNMEEKTGDGGAVSDKTSEEPMKETNESNSNNTDVTQQTDLRSGSGFSDVPLDWPV